MTLPREAAALLQRLELFGVRLGLEAPRRLLSALGSPQRRFEVVLVAGSTGKGSTACLLASMASAAGYRTGLYTSPHLEAVEERVRVGGRAVSGEELGESLLRTAAAAERVLEAPPTYFEALTAAAIDLFARRDVELGVLEVGLGGRLDATNATRPVLSVISEIGLEHRRHLGDTLEAIAREKAGILRPGRPAVTWVERPEARAEIRRLAAERGAELTEAAGSVGLQGVEDRGLDGARVAVETRTGRYVVDLRLPGEHQWRNLGLAVAAAEALAARGRRRLGRAAVEKGAAACRWPGRLERVGLPGGREAVLDVAHHPTAAAALACFLRRPGPPHDLLYGSLADKEIEQVLPLVAAGAGRIVLTAPGDPRAAAPAAMRSVLPGREATVEPRLEAALDAALAGPCRRLVVCGSVALVGEVRGLLRRRFGVPPPAIEIAVGPAPELPQERGS